MIEMISKFKKNSKKILKKAAGIGLGVLFALNATLTTAHALTAKDILAGHGSVSPEVISKLDASLAEAADGAKIAFVDLAQVRKALNESIIAYNTDMNKLTIRKNLIDQFKQDKDISDKTREKLVEAALNGTLDRGFFTNENGAEFLNTNFDCHMSLANPDSVFEQTFAMVALDIDRKNGPSNFIKNHPTMQNMTEEEELLTSVYLAVHETKHASQRAQLKKIHKIDAQNKALSKAQSQSAMQSQETKDKNEQNNKDGKTIILETENEADLAGARAVMACASNKEVGLNVVKRIADMRIKNFFAFQPDMHHLTIETLSTYIHSIDPSYEIIKTGPLENIQASLKDYYDAATQEIAAMKKMEMGTVLDFAKNETTKQLLRADYRISEEIETRNSEASRQTKNAKSTAPTATKKQLAPS